MLSEVHDLPRSLRKYVSWTTAEPIATKASALLVAQSVHECEVLPAAGLMNHATRARQAAVEA